MSDDLRTGPVVASDGSLNPQRGDKTGANVSTNAHLYMHEANYRGTLFTYGITSTALVAANAIATGVTSSAQPVIGLWNPSTSLVNLVVFKVNINSTVIANTAVAPGGFMWLVSTNQSAISTGSTPFNCKTLAQSGSSAKAFACSTALTGMSGSLTQLRAVSIATLNAAGPGTAIHQAIAPQEEVVDGALIVPPGGVLAVMNQLSTTTVSVNAGITWEEVAI